MPADGSADVTIHNEEWSIQVNIAKIDSETHQPIAADAEFAVFEWDTVEQMYIPLAGTTSIRSSAMRTAAILLPTAAAMPPAARLTARCTIPSATKAVFDRGNANPGRLLRRLVGHHPARHGRAGRRQTRLCVHHLQGNDGSVIDLSNEDYNADIGTADSGGTLLRTPEGNTVTVTLHDQPQEATRTYTTDSTGLANNEDSYTSTPVSGKFTNDRVIGEIVLTKSDLDQAVEGADTALHGTASIEGAVYDLYAAEDIQHPDGVSGTVDYSKIVDANGNPIWHTTVLTNGGGIPTICRFSPKTTWSPAPRSGTVCWLLPTCILANTIWSNAPPALSCRWIPTGISI